MAIKKIQRPTVRKPSVKKPSLNRAPRTRQGGNPLRVAPRRRAGSPNPKAMGIDPRGMGLGSNFFERSQQAGQNFGLPLNAGYEAGQRTLNDELTQTLAALAGLRPQIQSQGRLGMERLSTDLGRDMADLRDSLIGRGIYDSGIRGVDERELGNLYERQQQDLAFQVAAQLGDISNQEAQARLGHQQGLQELMLGLAQNEAMNPYGAAPNYLGPSFGGGGGGGGKKPGKKPAKKPIVKKKVGQKPPRRR